MANYFRPNTPGTQPCFVKTITTPEYQEGFLLGFLCNIDNYNTGPLNGHGSYGVLVTALSSVAAAGDDPDFAYPAVRAGIKNAVDLHKRTLWLGGGRISDSSGILFNKAMSVGLNLKCTPKSPHSFSCAQYVEELILRWGFSVLKDPAQTTMHIYPLFEGIDICGDTPVDRSIVENGGIRMGRGDRAEKAWGHISEAFGEDRNDMDGDSLDDFRRGFFDGINC